jgi:hypothetical protein
MQELHNKLVQNIIKQNLTTAKLANKHRLKGLILEKRDKVFLLRKNLKTKQLSNKLDNL